MATARKRQVSLVDTKYYHCISRCVRRAFLCGDDNVTASNISHSIFIRARFFFGLMSDNHPHQSTIWF